MNKNTCIYIANWKMNQSLDTAIAWMQALTDDQDLAEKSIIICPSFPQLYPLQKLTTQEEHKIGAQDCSAYTRGAYTGQVSAHDLRDVGCSYCIIGHSERRALGETNTLIAQKCIELLKNDIIPIICIGETEAEYKNHTAYEALANQLTDIKQYLDTHTLEQKNIIIAYEPLWSIGTGKIPALEYINDIASWLKNYTTTHFTHQQPIKLLYGGSVDEDSIRILKNLDQIDGFLIGGASLDFQKFKKIVVLD
jgi:triosephosphate isomerase (TIM)